MKLTDETQEATVATLQVPAVGKPHPQRNICPTCKSDLMRVGLNKIVYSFEVCQTHDGMTHIYEQMWHRAHFLADAPEAGW